MLTCEVISRLKASYFTSSKLKYASQLRRKLAVFLNTHIRQKRQVFTFGISRFEDYSIELMVNVPVG